MIPLRDNIPSRRFPAITTGIILLNVLVFLLQFFNGTLSLGSRNSFGGVAWWAHVGGFIFGLLVCLLVRRARAPARGIKF